MENLLSNRKWKDFKIGDIFVIGTGANVPKKNLKKGNIPRISAKEQNNGIVDFTEYSTHKNYRVKKNFISVSFLGAVFYHPYLASLDMKIHSIQIKDKELNKYIGNFLIIALKKVTKNASYGNQISSSDLPKKKIYLPVNSEGNPDYEFMEKYIQNKEKSKLDTYKKFILENREKIDTTKSINTLKEKKWKEFFFTEVFNIYSSSSSIDKNKLLLQNGKYPYITRSDKNNGIDIFIRKQNEKYNIDKKNVITIGLDTQTVFYQPYKFYTGQNIQILENNLLNKHIALFLIPLIKKQLEKFNWGGNGATLSRLKRSKILLPVNYNDNPDYEYMENYMKQVEFNKLKKYLKYKEIDI